MQLRVSWGECFVLGGRRTRGAPDAPGHVVLRNRTGRRVRAARWRSRSLYGAWTDGESTLADGVVARSSASHFVVNRPCRADVTRAVRASHLSHCYHRWPPRSQAARATGARGDTDSAMHRGVRASLHAHLDYRLGASNAQPSGRAGKRPPARLATYTSLAAARQPNHLPGRQLRFERRVEIFHDPDQPAHQRYNTLH